MVLDFLRVLVWPAVAIGGMFIFRGSIRSLLSRVKEGKLPGGVEFQLQAEVIEAQAAIEAGHRTVEQVAEERIARLEQFALDVASQSDVAVSERRKFEDEIAARNAELHATKAEIEVAATRLQVMSGQLAATRQATRELDRVLQESLKSVPGVLRVASGYNGTMIFVDSKDAFLRVKEMIGDRNWIISTITTGSPP